MAGPLLAALGPDRPPPSSIRTVSSSGGVLSPAMKIRLAHAFPAAEVVDAIGASETGLLGASSAHATAATAELRVMAAPNTLVVDGQGRPTPPGVVGMLAKSGTIPLRYHNDPDKTARTFLTYNGIRYAVPGDAARLEEDGTITVLGRESSCINTGGEKVYPTEVENVLKLLPSVGDCLVVGIPDPRWGERVGAIVEPVAGKAVSLEELHSHTRGMLAGYKAPRALCLVNQIARQPSGKPDYRWASSIVATGAWVRADAR
jgi:acyl-CoA synthetase (AMP-forming)/AMP-acid ligase II